MLRPLVSIFLLLVFILNVGGYYPLFKLEQWQVRKEVKRRLKSTVPSGELHTIDAGSPLVWHREGKEFQYGGYMYDIVRTDTLDGKVRYHCINDREEQALFAKLDQMVQDEMDHGNLPVRYKAARFLKLLASLTYLPGQSVSLDLNYDVVNTRTAYNNLYHSDFSADILHPPRA